MYDELFVCDIQQVDQLLVVHLQKRAVDRDILLAIIYPPEQMMHAPWNKPREILIRFDIPEKGGLPLPGFVLGILLDEGVPVAPEHRVGLAAAGLPIRQNRHVEALLDLLYGWTHILVQLLLGGLLGKGLVDGLADYVRGVADFDSLELHCWRYIFLDSNALLLSGLGGEEGPGLYDHADVGGLDGLGLAGFLVGEHEFIVILVHYKELLDRLK